MSDAIRIGMGDLPHTTLENIDDAAVPVDHIRFVKAITLTNTGAETCHVTITFAGTSVIYQYVLEAVGGENTITIPFFDHVMEAGERIQGLREGDDHDEEVEFYISGRQIDIS